jgi:rhodanese-related sulfurtransferase
MSIQSVVVKRVRNGVTYVPAIDVCMAADDAVIISIVEEGDRRPDFKPGHTVLELTTFCSGIEGRHLREVIPFVEANRGKNIVVHCYYGQQRSKSVAEQIALRFPEYTLTKHSPDFMLHWRFGKG